MRAANSSKRYFGEVKERSNRVASLFLMAIIVIISSLGLTFYIWKITSQGIYNRSLAEFETLTTESEKALLYRIDSYNYAVLGGVGFLEGSDNVTRSEWKTYNEKIDVKKSYPGINGLAYTKKILPGEASEFIKQMRDEGAADFFIHPETSNRPLYVVSYIEPLKDNEQAVGRNMAFEDNRLKALQEACDTGKSIITNPIVLAQDEEKTPGFLLVHPVYKKNQNTGTLQERQKSLSGWVMAPIIARKFLDHLTEPQGNLFHLKVYDGDKEEPDALIYNSNRSTKVTEPIFTIRKEADVLGQKWLLTWESTLAYEQLKSDATPLFVIIGGVLLTAALALFFLVFIARNKETTWLAEEKRFLIPGIVFILGCLFSYWLYDTLAIRERSYLRNIVEDEAQKIEQLISTQTNQKLLAIKRMAQRWEAAEGTTRKLWQEDASNYVGQVGGLKAMEWVDSTYHVRWIEPALGNEKAVNLNILYNNERKEALKGAEAENHLTITPPLGLVQGYRAFIVYAPIHYSGKFDGFMAGVFSVEDFLKQSLQGETINNFAINFSYNGNTFFQNGTADSAENLKWGADQQVRILDQTWNLTVVPTENFIQRQLSRLPLIVMISGLIISFLLAATVRFILVARAKSFRLEEATILREAILASTKYIVIATDKDGNILLVNDQAEAKLGENKRDILNKMIPRRWLKEKEFTKRMQDLEIELGEKIEPNFDVFSKKAAITGLDVHEWTFVSTKGREFPVRLSVTPIKESSGEIVGFLGIAEDITEWKLQQEALKNSEQTFRDAMEYASIGMALVDLQGRWLKANPALCDITGYSEEELLKTNFQAITHPEDLDKDLQYLGQILKGEINSYHMEKRYFRKDGATIWVNLSVSLARNIDNSPKHFIAQIQDITERLEIERMKNEFISVVSHELRTPLTSIRGSLGLIEGTMTAEIPSKALHLINIAHKNCERLINLINDILDLDKIVAGKMRFDMSPEKVCDLINSGIEANTAYASKFNIKFLLQNCSPDWIINVDADRFQQILSNLLSNAAKFSASGTSVLVYVSKIHNRIRISVKDSGPGISDEFRSRIFSKFSQADSTNTRSKGGTGLGLNISKEMVNHMGGEIGFENDPDGGAVFWFDFPAVETNLAISHGPDLPVILHIEDDSDFSEFISAAIMDKARIITAPTLGKARELMAGLNISLVILDIQLPDGNGLTYLDYLEQFKSPPPVMILSGDEPPESVREKVAYSVVKSRVSEAKIVEIILSLIGKKF